MTFYVFLRFFFLLIAPLNHTLMIVLLLRLAEIELVYIYIIIYVG